MNWRPPSGRIRSINRAIENNELLVAVIGDMIVGFIHLILHEDMIDGAPNSFITAFYVRKRYRRRGIGTHLLREAVIVSAARGATFVETSTIQSRAKTFYERHGFSQTIGDIGELFLELDVTNYLETLWVLFNGLSCYHRLLLFLYLDMSLHGELRPCRPHR